MQDLEDQDDIWVFPNILATEHGCFVTSIEPMPFECFVQQFRSDVPKIATSKATDVADPSALPADTMPWVKQHLMRKALGIKRTGAGSEKPMPEAFATDDDEEYDEVVMHEVHADLDRLRMEWQAAHASDEAALIHFKVEHRGGEWTFKNLGVFSDSCRGIPCTDVGRNFLTKWNLPKQFANAYTRYTLPISQMLSKAWCHRMSYFCCAWAAGGHQNDFVFTQDHLARYVEEADLILYRESWEENSVASQRLAYLRSIAPDGHGNM